LWNQASDKDAHDPILREPQPGSKHLAFTRGGWSEDRKVHSVRNAPERDRSQTKLRQFDFNFFRDRHADICLPEQDPPEVSQGEPPHFRHIPIGTTAGWAEHDGLPFRPASSKKSDMARRQELIALHQLEPSPMTAQPGGCRDRPYQRPTHSSAYDRRAAHGYAIDAVLGRQPHLPSRQDRHCVPAPHQGAGEQLTLALGAAPTRPVIRNDQANVHGSSPVATSSVDTIGSLAVAAR
jgi:hypothetical protein